jgi:hypothetical protein
VFAGVLLSQLFFGREPIFQSVSVSFARVSISSCVGKSLSVSGISRLPEGNTNRRRVRGDLLETKLLAGLQEEVLWEDVVNYTLDRFEQQLEGELSNIGGEMDPMRKRKAELDSETACLTAGLASGLCSVTVMAEIARREKEIADKGDRLLSSPPDSVRSKIQKLRQRALAKKRELREYLSGEPTAARAWLAQTSNGSPCIRTAGSALRPGSGTFSEWDM